MLVELNVVEQRLKDPACLGCGATPKVDRDPVLSVDLPVFGRKSRLSWRKHRWRCGTASRAVPFAYSTLRSA